MTVTWSVKLVSVSTKGAIQLVEAVCGLVKLPAGATGLPCDQVKVMGWPSGSEAATERAVKPPSDTVVGPAVQPLITGGVLTRFGRLVASTKSIWGTLTP